jgi:uncharacterized protein YuzE
MQNNSVEFEPTLVLYTDSDIAYINLMQRIEVIDRLEYEGSAKVHYAI